MKQLPVALLTMGLALAASLAAAPSARVQTSKPKMRYAAEKAGDSVVLTDRTTDTTVSILPSLGNIAYEMKVRGHNVLRYPHATIEEFRKAPNGIGVPFMGPWANRLDEQAFYANGKRYPFDMALGNVRGADSHPRLRHDDRPVEGRRHEGHRRRGVRHQPPRVLQAAGVDEAVAVRPHRRHDLPPEGRRARGRDGGHQPVGRADAARHRLPPVLPAHRHASATSGRSASARRSATRCRRRSCRPARPSRSRRSSRIPPPCR